MTKSTTKKSPAVPKRKQPIRKPAVKATSKAVKTTRRKTTSKRSRASLRHLWFIGIGILVLIAGGVALNIYLASKQHANAITPMAITTFTSKYKGYNPGTSWISSYTMEQRCSKDRTIYGAKPVAAGTYPTLVYLHGTTADNNSNKEGQQFVKRAAAQGFNAFAVTYDSGGTLNEKGLQRHAYCIFDQNHANNGLSAVCAAAGATCSDGVLLSGFSQGAAISTIAKNYNSNVKAVWAIGLSAYIYPKYTIPTDALPAPHGTRVLPNDKIAINMGEASNTFKRAPIKQDLPSLKQLTGVDCGTGYDCIQANGSGYYVVSNAEIKDEVADHCYWQMVNKWTNGLSCTTAPTEFDPGFQPPATTKWSMIKNLDWLRAQL